MSIDIFISHRSKDQKLAKQFKLCLMCAGFPDTSIFIAEELHPGEPWHTGILQALQTSEIFYLLFTDPSYDWDWCLFEAGYWLGMRKQIDVGGLICINAGVGRPSPLNSWEDIHTEEDLTAHLINLVNRNPPLTSLQGRSFGNTFTAMILTMVADFWKELHPIAPVASHATLDNRCILSLTVTGEQMAQIKEGRDIPRETKVEVNTGAGQIIFPQTYHVHDWAGFVENLVPFQRAWTPSLSTVLRMLNGKNKESPFLPSVRAGTFDSSGNQPIYQPFVSTRLQHDDGTLTFQVEFVRRPDVIAVTDDLDRFYQYLVLARNFRYGVLKHYQQEFEEGDQFDTKLAGFLDEINLIRIDLQSRGLDPNRDFAEGFSAMSRQEILRLMEEWDAAEKTLRRMHDRSSFNHSEVNRIMEQLLHINMLFSLVMCSALQGRLCFA